LLELRNLTAGYGPQIVIRAVNLTVAAGEVVALIGANGAGKSTLAKAISGLLPARYGTVQLDGLNITTRSVAARVRHGLAQVPEGRQVFSGLTVGQNLEMGAYLRRDVSTRARLADEMDTVFQLFPALRHRVNHMAGNLSGGQQQMLAIGRGLMAKPRLLIIDEPSLGLAPSLVKEMFELISSLRARGLAILLAEQNARMSLAIADRGYVMENGRIIMSDTAANLSASQTIAERYLGLGDLEAKGRFDRHTQTRLVNAIRAGQSISAD
jgi:branched-chain amino acid transport system ATP-binding protein